MQVECNYPAHKLEFLALKWAVCDKFSDYLYGSNFTVMPSLHLAYDESTTTVRCLKSHFRAIYVRRSHDIVRFHGHRGVVVASTILFNSELYKKIKNVRS